MRAMHQSTLAAGWAGAGVAALPCLGAYCSLQGKGWDSAKVAESRISATRPTLAGRC